MRVLILDTCYKAFLDEHYSRSPELVDAPYAAQWRALMDTCFGTADFYSRNLEKLGHEAAEIVVNCAPLQWQWGVENGFRPPREWGKRQIGGISLPWFRQGDWKYALLKAQIKKIGPEIIHVQNPNSMPAGFFREIRAELGGRLHLLTAQIASPKDVNTDFRQYDLILSSFPHFVEAFKNEGLRSEYFRLGFEPSILEKLSNEERAGAVFVGGISHSHGERLEFFEHLASLVDFDWWGYGCDRIRDDSPLKSCWRGEAWGLQMYQRLKNARISINHHIDVAQGFANNMRLYEATGVGSMLLTDSKINLADHFEPSIEVVTYETVEDCAGKLTRYLADEAGRCEIARAGQKRTLKEHSYLERMREYLKLVSRFC